MTAKPAQLDASHPAARVDAALLAVAVVLALLMVAVQSFVRVASPTTARPLALRIDPNTASREELMLLPRIGAGTADALIAVRGDPQTPRPAFQTLADLERLPHVGPRTVELWSPYLALPAPPAE